MPSEKQILDELRARYGKARVRGLRLGIGDDAALLRSRAGCELVVTTDLFLEQVHFRREWTSARNAGSKAAARALSDIAAMGAIPRFVFLSLAVPRRLSGRWLEEFFRGALALSRRFAVALAGGDLASSPDRVVLDVVGVGEVERGRALLRSGARPGDAIFVTGTLGLARLGLEFLRRRAIRFAPLRAALRAHLTPSPRCSVGRYLVRRQLATAAIDLSDGLSTDLHHLCEESGVGASIDASRIPIATIPADVRDRFGLDPLNLALHGGEDYELLFTVPRAKASRVPRLILGVSLTRIGEVTRERDVMLVAPSDRNLRLRPLGFDHFR